MLITVRYDRFVGFCKACGLLEHGLNGCSGLVAAEEEANHSSNPNLNSTPIFGSRQGSLSLGPSFGLSVGDAGLIFQGSIYSTGGNATCSIAFHHSRALRG